MQNILHLDLISPDFITLVTFYIIIRVSEIFLQLHKEVRIVKKT